MEPGREVTGYLTRKHIYEIAKIKSQVVHLEYFSFRKGYLPIVTPLSSRKVDTWFCSNSTRAPSLS
jgi:hypothetical protein